MYGSTLFIETFIFGVNNIQVDRDKVPLWAWGFFSEKIINVIFILVTFLFALLANNVPTTPSLKNLSKGKSTTTSRQAICK